LLPLLEPVSAARHAHNQKQTHWHGDETRWQVFATVEGKAGYLWYLWLMLSAEAAVFVLAAGRAHEVPEAMLGEDARGIFNADRYAAYPARKQVKQGPITLALCWAHQRRDLIEAARRPAARRSTRTRGWRPAPLVGAGGAHISEPRSCRQGGSHPGRCDDRRVVGG
jgi:Transposase IS66 family